MNIRLELDVVDTAALIAAASEAYARSLPGSNTPDDAVAAFLAHLRASPCSAVQQLLDVTAWLTTVPGVSLATVSVEGQDLGTEQR